MVIIHTSYTNRRRGATLNVALLATKSGLARKTESAQLKPMFDRYKFLERVLAQAPTRQAVLDAINLPSSRGPSLFNRTADKPRGLSVEEAITLSDRFGVPLQAGLASAESLLPILRICLRHAPASWDDRAVKRLASEIEFGLKLQGSNGPIADDLDDLSPAYPDEAQPPRQKLD